MDGVGKVVFIIVALAAALYTVVLLMWCVLDLIKSF